MNGADSSVPPRSFPGLWTFVCAAPVVLLMAVALVNDPRRLGDPSSANDAPLPALIAVAVVVTGLLGGVWAFSRFRYRTEVALTQVAVVWVGGLLYGFDVRTQVTGWDVAEDAVLLLTTLLQLVPGNRTSVAERRSRERASDPGADRRPLRERLRRPLGLVFVGWIIVRNRADLTSGEALPTVGVAALIAFVAWVSLRPNPYVDPGGVTADQWRTRSRREMTCWAGWTLTAVAVVTWAALENGFKPGSLIFVGLPLFALLGSAFGYAKADTITEHAAQRS